MTPSKQKITVYNGLRNTKIESLKERSERKKEKRILAKGETRRYDGIKSKLPKDFDGKNPTEKYQIVWENRKKSAFWEYLSYPLVNELIHEVPNELHEQDEWFLQSIISAIFKTVENDTMADPVFDALRKSASLPYDQKIATVPNFAKLKRQFDSKVMLTMKDTIDNLIAVLDQEIKRYGDEENEAKGYIRRIQIYLQEVYTGFLTFQPLVDNLIDERQIDQIISNLGNESITEDDVNKFSDYFTSLPARQGAKKREELGKKILKNGKYTSDYIAGLRVRDRFGNTLFSMALSAIPASSRDIYRESGVITLNQKAEVLGRVEDLKIELKSELKELRKSKTQVIATPIWQYLNDSSRELLRAQLRFEGMETSYIGRYPTDRAKLQASYETIMSRIHPGNEEFLLNHILTQEINYDDNSWPKYFQRVLTHKCLRGVVRKTVQKPRRIIRTNYSVSGTARQIITRLKSRVMSRSLFNRIKEKTLTRYSELQDEEFLQTAFAQQVKILFKLSFQAFKNMLEIVEQDWFKFDLCGVHREYQNKNPDYDQNEGNKMEANLGSGLLYEDVKRFIKTELSLQLLFYLAFFKEQREVTEIVNQFSSFIFRGDQGATSSTLFDLQLSVLYEGMNNPILLENPSPERAVLDLLSRVYRSTLAKSTQRFAIEASSSLLADLAAGSLTFDWAFADAVEKCKHLLDHGLVRGAANSKSASAAVFILAIKLRKLGHSQLADQMLKTLVRHNVFQEIFSKEATKGRLFIPSNRAQVIIDKPCRRHNRAEVGATRKLQSIKAFCRQALEVLAVYYHDDQKETVDTALSFFASLAPLVKVEYLFEAILKFVASKYSKANPRLQKFLAFLVNNFLTLEASKLLSTEEDPSEPKSTSLLHNRFIQTAIAKNFVTDRCITADSLLQPVFATDSSSTSLTQTQLFNITLLASQSDFAQVAFSTGLSEDQKLAVFGVDSAAIADPALKAMLLKLLKIPGMTRHCLKYACFAERLDVHAVANMERSEALKVLEKLSDRDFEKFVRALWKLFAKEFDEDDDRPWLQMIIYAGLSSRSFSKLFTVISLIKEPCQVCHDTNVGRIVLDRREYVHVLALWDRTYKGDEKICSDGDEAQDDFPSTLGIHCRWPDLGRLLYMAGLSSSKSSLPLIEHELPFRPVAISSLANNIQKYFKWLSLSILEDLGKVPQSKHQELADFLTYFVKWPRCESPNTDQESKQMATLAGMVWYAHQTKPEDDGSKKRKKRYSSKDVDYKPNAYPDRYQSRSPFLNSDLKSLESSLEAYSSRFRGNNIVGSWNLENPDLERFVNEYNKIHECWFDYFIFAANCPWSMLNYHISHGDQKKETFALFCFMATMIPNILEVALFAPYFEKAELKRIFVQEYINLRRLSVATEKDSESDPQDFTQYCADQTILTGIILCCLTSDPKFVGEFVASLSSLSSNVIEKLFRYLHLNRPVFERIKGFNESNFLQVKNFLDTGAKQSVTKFRDEEEFRRLHETTVNSEHPFQRLKNYQTASYLDYLDLINIARENETNLAKDPDPICRHQFRSTIDNCLFTFYPSLIKEIFSDKSLGITKLLKAFSAIERVMKDMRNIPVLSSYMKEENDATSLADLASTLNFNPFEREFVNVNCCGIDEQLGGDQDEQLYCKIAFSVSNNKDQYSQGEEVSIKVDIKVAASIDGTVFWFDPKARLRTSQYDYFAKMASLAEETKAMEKKLNLEVLQENIDKSQNLFGSSLNIVPYKDRAFFSSNYGENFIGFSSHNEKFAKKFKKQAGLVKNYQRIRNTIIATNAPTEFKEFS
jgi:hypothetical protein